MSCKGVWLTLQAISIHEPTLNFLCSPNENNQHNDILYSNMIKCDQCPIDYYST